tara:strand:- start:107 stop:598 length:492 start_codon:yes stop_codon:yes gene_type:complete
MDLDNLVECPCCGSDACSKTPINNLESGINSYLCWTCGFTTNDLLEHESDFEKENYGLTAELIKDLKQVHINIKGLQLAWYPKVINLQEKGMVFPEWNKRIKDWKWAAVKAIPVLEAEREKYPDPLNPGEYYKFRMDMKQIKRFQKLEFMDAAEEIGLFDGKL